MNSGRGSEEMRFVLCGLMLVSALATAETYTGHVIGVADGDTVTVLDEYRQQHKVRLGGIDAPEKRQPYGQVSKKHLSNLVFGKMVTIETSKRDRYRREVGRVLINGHDANLKQIEAGLAWHYKKYSDEQSSADRLSYAAAEVEAQRERRGLWQDSNPVAPWDFRHQKKGQ